MEECPSGKKAGGRREGRPRRSDGVEVGGLSSIELSGLGRLVARETRLRLGRGKDPKR